MSSYFLNNTAIKEVARIRDLGVVLARKLRRGSRGGRLLRPAPSATGFFQCYFFYPPNIKTYDLSLNRPPPSTHFMISAGVPPSAHKILDPPLSRLSSGIDIEDTVCKAYYNIGFIYRNFQTLISLLFTTTFSKSIRICYHYIVTIEPQLGQMIFSVLRYLRYTSPLRKMTC